MIRLTFRDHLRTALIGPRSRPLRTALSALGIAALAAITAIAGIAASDQAQLLASLDDQGANMIVVRPGDGPDGTPVPLPETAPGMISRLDPVERVGIIAGLYPALSASRLSPTIALRAV